MERKSERKSYVRPKIISEKVFEHAALACSMNPYANAAVNPKTFINACGFASS